MRSTRLATIDSQLAHGISGSTRSILLESAFDLRVMTRSMIWTLPA
jgi:hypothetical protein